MKSTFSKRARNSGTGNGPKSTKHVRTDPHPIILGISKCNIYCRRSRNVMEPVLRPKTPIKKIHENPKILDFQGPPRSPWVSMGLHGSPVWGRRQGRSLTIRRPCLWQGARRVEQLAKICQELVPTGLRPCRRPLHFMIFLVPGPSKIGIQNLFKK